MVAKVVFSKDAVANLIVCTLMDLNVVTYNYTKRHELNLHQVPLPFGHIYMSTISTHWPH